MICIYSGILSRKQRSGTGIALRERSRADIGKYCVTTVQFKIVDIMDVVSTTLVTISPGGRNGERLSRGTKSTARVSVC